MKTMTCVQLGGACDKEFRANTFEEMAKMSQEHGKEMFQKEDVPHMEAAKKMIILSPEAQKSWFENKRREFDALAEDK
ncbi:DUF1059 domain-containing protein [Sporosarcina sp. CAU 1771]